MNTGANPKLVLDASVISPRERHPAIMSLFDALRAGECFELVNDHDPIPLRFQFESRFPGRYAWDYLKQGPDEYRIRIARQ